jgi:alginate O-acetyltransferase complex protein AlgI
MSFDTLPFLCFFLVVYVGARMVPRTGWLLLVASVVCYAFSGLQDTALFAGVIFVNYLLSLWVRPGRSSGLIVAVLFNVGVLAAFKYRNFLFGLDPASGSFAASLAIPLGISFYTFQSIAYLADIYRGDVKAERSLVRFALFKGLFPQLVAGPIVRAHTLLPQVRRMFAGTLKPSRLIGFCLLLCLVGLVKKVVFADSLAPVVDDIFTRGPAGMATAWLGVWLFAFQIYFDFSGYSDMAVGMARLLGARLPINFRTPYLATSPREFWQRWHITLSIWIRDYLYVPLGGSRAGGSGRQLAVLIAVMGLAGFWHGANWTFIAWGLCWGLAIAGWRAVARIWPGMPHVAGWLATMSIVLMLWVLFRAPSLDFALGYLRTMAGGQGLGTASYMSSAAANLLIAAGAILLLVLHDLERRASTSRVPMVLRRLEGPFLHGCLLAVIAWLVIMPKTNLNPFIYFRF